MTIRINASELHQKVGEVLAQIRYGGKRVIIERRGEPVAAVISLEDLEQLQNFGSPAPRSQSKKEQLAALERSAALRELIKKRRRGKPLPDSAETIRNLREERSRHVAGLR